MSDTTPLEKILKRDRVIVIVCLVLITGLSWLYLVDMARDMASMDMSGMDMGGMDMSVDMPMGDAMDMPADAPMDQEMDMAEAMPADDDAMSTADGGMGEAMSGMMDMTQIQVWTPGYFTMMFLMWAIMMVGMMVPSAAPMVLVYAMMVRKNQKAAPYLSTGAFLSGYILVWTGFSLAATVLQWGLDTAALLSPMMVSTSPLLGGGLLIVAGVYQITPWKNACLAHCRSPIQFFMMHWRKGRAGALRMGLEHGAFCLGCCWFLMLLLFFGGVMNLLWILAIAVFVLVEKIVPDGVLFGRVAAPLLILVGVAVLIIG